MREVLLAAILFTAATWLVISVVWPTQPPLGNALTRLHTPSPLTAPAGTVTGRIKVWVATKLSTIDGFGPDLAILGKTSDGFATTVMTSIAAGVFGGPLVGLVFSLSTGSLSWTFPVLLLLAGGILGAVIPLAHVRSAASSSRRDARHALGAWLDMVVLLIASGTGPESAMAEAAAAGTDSPAFQELRRVVSAASFGASLWEALDHAGQRIGVVEFQELAAVAQLSVTSGVSIRESLVVKARTMRSHLLSDQKASAAQKGRMMTLPIIVIGCAFMIYIVYPLITNISLT
jgi:tight adherence protein C